MATELTPEMINLALANTRERGGLERRIKAFNSENVLYAVLTDEAKYGQMNKAGLKSQASKKVKELGEDFAHISVIKTDGGDIALINTNLLNAEDIAA